MKVVWSAGLSEAQPQVEMCLLFRQVGIARDSTAGGYAIARRGIFEPEETGSDAGPGRW